MTQTCGVLLLLRNTSVYYLRNIRRFASGSIVTHASQLRSRSIHNRTYLQGKFGTNDHIHPHRHSNKSKVKAQPTDTLFFHILMHSFCHKHLPTIISAFHHQWYHPCSYCLFPYYHNSTTRVNTYSLFISRYFCTTALSASICQPFPYIFTFRHTPLIDNGPALCYISSV